MNSKLIKNIFFVIIYVYAYFNFFAEFIFSSLIQSESIIFLLLDIVLLILGIITIRSRSDKYYFGIFILLTLISQIYNQYYDPILYLNGFRDFIPIFCAPFIIKYLLKQQGSSIINSFNKFLKLFLLLQIPVAILQYKEYGPGDYVGGTLGEGASGTLSLFIYVSTFYIFRYENISFSIKNFKKLIFIFACWFPTFINETKISFILLPLFFILQLQLNKAQLFKSILLILFFLPLMFISLKYSYLSNNRVSNVQFNQEYVKAYLFGETRRQEYERTADLPRFLRLGLGIKALSEDNFSLFVGKGLGQFKGGTTLDKTEFAKQNEAIMSGSIIYLFFIIMQAGFLGLILILSYLSKHFLAKSPNQDLNAVFFFFIIALISIFYGTTLRNVIFSILFFFVILMAKMPKYQIRTGN